MILRLFIINYNKNNKITVSIYYIILSILLSPKTIKIFMLISKLIIRIVNVLHVELISDGLSG